MLNGVSVVVPVYKSQDSLRLLVQRIEKAIGESRPFEIIMVDDGSPSSTWAVVVELAASHSDVVGVRLGRNYGQHNALVAGVRTARFPLVVTLDDDLQNPPEEIARLLEPLDSGALDVVYGIPERMDQSKSRRFAGRITRSAMKSGLGIDEAPSVTSYRAFRTNLRDAFAGDIGTNVSLDALLTWGSSNFGSVEVQHDRRLEGSSNYSVKKLIRFAIDTTTGYSTAPLQAASIFGFIVAFFGFASLVWVVGRPLITGESVPGFPFLAATVAIFSGVQLFTLGVIGEYLSRMHFRIMKKPTYLIAEFSGVQQGRLNLGSNDSIQ